MHYNRDGIDYRTLQTHMYTLQCSSVSDNSCHNKLFSKARYLQSNVTCITVNVKIIHRPTCYLNFSLRRRCQCLTNAFVLSSRLRFGSVVLLNVLGCRLTYQGQAETSAEARFCIALRPRKPEGSLGRTAQHGHLDSHTAPDSEVPAPTG